MILPSRSRPPLLRSAALALLAIGAAACSEPAGPAPPAVVAAAISEVPAALVRRIEVSLDRPGRVEATWRADGAPTLRLTSELVTNRHTLTLAQLRAERTYTVEVHALDGNDRSGEPWVGEFTTAPLPAGLAGIPLDAEGTPTHPLTMLEVTRGDAFRGYVAVDARGEVVWFHQTVGGANGSVRRADGSFLLIDEGRGLLNLAPDGRVVGQVPQDSANRMIHHDVLETATGTVLFLAQDWLERDGVRLAGEAVWEWDPEGETLAKRWSAWSHMDPDSDRGVLSVPHDWMHANALSAGPRGNWVVSLHYLNQVLSITSDFQALEWRMGGPNATIRTDDAERFTGQHTAAEIAPNRVLMFDNGFERTAERYSRAVEFELDPAAGTATKVWEWRPTPDVWSRIVSLARRLANGHTFVAFGAAEGFVGSTGPVAAYEVDAAGAVRWRLTVGGVPLLYRAWPLDDIAEEVVVPMGSAR